ncbi:MAG: hypothetical protein KIT72_06515 [Polyangiaceae bacterium]|nr:hypothetical protein [Polyangiaceae bacterium]MCW5790055.1 hypothetical protein [Polyangiaceae bacterium]
MSLEASRWFRAVVVAALASLLAAACALNPQPEPPAEFSNADANGGAGGSGASGGSGGSGVRDAGGDAPGHTDGDAALMDSDAGDAGDAELDAADGDTSDADLVDADADATDSDLAD